jgi:tetratricopeptide (TPR) repeat protein
MAHRGKIQILPALALVATLASSGWAQKGGGGGGRGTSPSRSTNPSQCNTQPDLGRIILNGMVVTEDGGPPPERVAIERVCGTRVTKDGYTDAKGFFSLQLGQTPFALQDASEGGAFSGSGAGVAGANTLSSNSSCGDQINRPRSFSLVGCELRGVLHGYRSSTLLIHNIDTVQMTNVGTIVLMRAEKTSGSTVSATSLRAPKDAKKAYEKSKQASQKNKIDEAQAELQRAVQIYPQYALAWNDLGWLYTKTNHLEKARNAFAQSRSADDRFVPPYMGLASLALRESKWPEAAEMSAKAMELDAVEFPAAFYYNAVANFQLGQLDHAEQTARQAERMNAQRAIPQIDLLLGMILAQKHDYSGAAEELKQYLKAEPTAPNADRVRQELAELEKLAQAKGPAPTDSAPASQ